MNNEPKFEIWGGYTEDSHFGAPDEFLEDCFTYDEMKKALAEYRKQPYKYAFAIDIETGKSLDI